MFCPNVCLQAFEYYEGADRTRLEQLRKEVEVEDEQNQAEFRRYVFTCIYVKYVVSSLYLSKALLQCAGNRVVALEMRTDHMGCSLMGEDVVYGQILQLRHISGN